MASPADLAEVDAVDIISLVDAGMVTIGLADLADTGMAFPADPAGAGTIVGFGSTVYCAGTPVAAGAAGPGCFSLG